jgi:hypothetical protein
MAAGKSPCAGCTAKVRFRLQRYRQRQTGLKSTYFDLTDQFQEG